jgi:hypothetical protein
MRRSMVAIFLVLAGARCSSSTPAHQTGTGGSGVDGGATDAGGGGDAGGDGDAGVPDDIDMTAADFVCIKRWTSIRLSFITNELDNLAGSLAVADSADGGTYPVGTVIQLIPTEAMVKRKAGFSPQTNDWEFFTLGVSDAGTTINARGTTTVMNAGGTCLSCHAMAAPQWDLICEETHGCNPLPVTDAMIQAIQNSDPRCP